jgi:hypothetical protein
MRLERPTVITLPLPSPPWALGRWPLSGTRSESGTSKIGSLIDFHRMTFKQTSQQ